MNTNLALVRTRRWWVFVHRCSGLFLAGFLTLSGLTGAFLAFKDEIGAVLSPERFHVTKRSESMMDPFQLREKAMACVPGANIRWMDLFQEEGKPAIFQLEPKAVGEHLPCFRIFLDPYTGEEVARQDNEGGWPLSTKDFMPWILSLHESLLSGKIGTTVLGLIALIWTVDCFVGLFLTLPGPAAKERGCPLRWFGRWAPAWQIAWKGRTYRFQFTLHRALGLWLWPILLVFAVSAVSFNLPEIYQPLMKHLFGMPDVLGNLPDDPQGQTEPRIGWREAALLGEKFAREQATLMGWKIRRPDAPASMGYIPEKGVYFFESRGEKDVGKYMPTVTAYVDANTGKLKGCTYASGWHPALTFTSWIYALHTRTIGGKPMQALVCIVGLLIPVIACSGVYLWWRKRRTRLHLLQTQYTSNVPKP